MTAPDRRPATETLRRRFNWKTCFLAAVLGVSLALLSTDAPTALVLAAPVIGAIYAALFMSGTRFFGWLFAKVLFKD